VKQSRNQLCSCGSGKKYKKCCWGKVLHAPKLSEIPRVEQPAPDESDTAESKHTLPLALALLASSAFLYQPRRKP
jgi:hypothetical protein